MNKMRSNEEERVFSVGEVNRMADSLLQELVIWVEGEVSNLRPYPQYTFFSLSDEEAVLPCIMFREALEGADFEIREGAGLLARGRLGVYVRRGQYRMNVYEVQEAGEGRLRREFLRLMRKLSQEGLFDERLKRPLPPFPDLVGLITSLEGAAVRDVVTNLTRRFPCCRLVIRGVRVQGEEAVGDIVSAINLFNRAYPVDVLILARGGGSLEDLQPFNTEEVVRAIRASAIPVVTGVGHEPDLTLADLAADYRASTPTGAAEAVVPSSSEVMALLDNRESSLSSGLRRRLHLLEREFQLLAGRRSLTDPSFLLDQPRQRLAEAETAIAAGMEGLLAGGSARTEEYARLLARYPREYRELPERIGREAAKLVSAFRAWWRWRASDVDARRKGLRAAASGLLSREESGLRLAASRLEALSPLAVLSRGYAIASRRGERRPLLDSDEVEEGQEIDVRLHRGTLFCEVTGKENQERGE